MDYGRANTLGSGSAEVGCTLSSPMLSVRIGRLSSIADQLAAIEEISGETANRILGAQPVGGDASKRPEPSCVLEMMDAYIEQLAELAGSIRYNIDRLNSL